MADKVLGVLRWVVSQRLGDSTVVLSGLRKHPPPAPSPSEKEALQSGENLTFLKAHNITADRLIIPCHFFQFLNIEGIRQETHIHYNIRIRWNSILKTKG